MTPERHARLTRLIHELTTEWGFQSIFVHCPGPESEPFESREVTAIIMANDESQMKGAALAALTFDQEERRPS